MALPRTVINCLLETNVLATSEEIEGTKRGGRIGRVEYEGASHAPRACHAQSICFWPAEGCKGGTELRVCANERDVDGVTRQSIACNCEARHKFALEDFETDANGARQDNIRCDSISQAQAQKPRQPGVSSFKDHRDDQPDT